MKSLTTVGIILLSLSVILFSLTTDFSVESIKMNHIMGILGGVGIGLIIGGIVGYVSKGSAIKAEQKRKEFLQLQKEKAEIEKQAAALATQQAEFAKQQQQAQNSQNPNTF